VATVFGRCYISNPDLAFRLKNNVGLTKYNRATFYKAQSTEGYTEYPFSKEYETIEQSVV
jgi:NADPH2 dehydrogenase